MTAAGSRTKRSGKQRETCDFATSAKPWCQRTTVRKIGPFARCETERIAIVERVGSINQSRTKCEREIVGRGLFATGRMCQCVFVREAKDCKTRLNNGPVTDFDGPSARLFGCFLRPLTARTRFTERSGARVEQPRLAIVHPSRRFEPMDHVSRVSETN